MSSSSFSWGTSSSSGSLFPLLSSLIQPIPDEEFKLFHAMDRKLFSNLLFNHGREAHESMLVMAFWMWIQREEIYCRRLIEKISTTVSPHQVSQAVNETLICLSCIQNNYFPFSGCDEEIENLQSLMEGKRLRLQELHENRVEILSSVMSIADKICARAFNDILEDTFGASIVFNNPNDEGRNNSTSNRIGTYMPPVIGMPSHPRCVPQIRFLEVPQFVPDEGIGHGIGNGVPLFAPNEGVGHADGMGVPLFAPNEGVGHGNTMGVPLFAPNEGVRHGNAMGSPHLVPNEGLGHVNGMGVPLFAPNEGVGHGNGMGVPHFAPNEGAGHGNAMGSPHLVPNEGLGHGNEMGVQHLAPNEGVGHMNAIIMPHFVPNEGVGQGNRMSLVHFVPNEVFVHGMDMAQHFEPSDGHGLAAMGVPNQAVVPSHMVDIGLTGANTNFNAVDDLQNQQPQQMEFVNRDLDLMMRRFHISERDADVPADDRTLFLTFSKGYPISENEVRNFLVRKFGNFIEAIYMQEVAPTAQSLYARVVAHRLSDVYRVLRNERTAKFYINGKHVWAREYEKNNTPRTPGRGGPVR